MAKSDAYLKCSGMTPLSIADCGFRIGNPEGVGVRALPGIAPREAPEDVGRFQSAIQKRHRAADARSRALKNPIIS